MDSPKVSSTASPNSSANFDMLSDAPLSSDWNKENVPLPDSPTAGIKPLGQQSTPTGNFLKRPFTPDNGEPFQIKRRKGLHDRSFSMEDVEDTKNAAIGASPSFVHPASNSTPTTPRRQMVSTTPPTGRRQPIFAVPTLQRSYSEANAMQIMKSCQNADSQEDLTGDFSKKLVLPTLKKNLRHSDLRTIDCHTLARLLHGQYDHLISSFRIIDARYTYEFDGGHIKGAESFGKWEEKVFFDEFLPMSKGLARLDETPDDKTKRNILIFHCEFSQARGPSLMRDLRKRDRCMNKDSYPALHYPECYLLHNGYKEFYANYPELCDPMGYTPMADPNYSHLEKKFKTKAKTWGGRGSRAASGTSSRLLKL